MRGALGASVLASGSLQKRQLGGASSFLTPLSSGDALRAPLSPYSCCPHEGWPQKSWAPQRHRGTEAGSGCFPWDWWAESLFPRVSQLFGAWPGVPSVVHLAPGPQLTCRPGGRSLLRWEVCAQAGRAPFEQAHRPGSLPWETSRRRRLERQDDLGQWSVRQKQERGGLVGAGLAAVR